MNADHGRGGFGVMCVGARCVGQSDDGPSDRNCIGVHKIHARTLRSSVAGSLNDGKIRAAKDRHPLHDTVFCAQ